MKEQETTSPANYKSLMKARKEGLLVQTEAEYRSEQYRVMENRIKQRQELFEGFYGGVVTQKQRNEYYALIDRQCRQGEEERNAFYPKSVRAKMQYVRELLAELRELGVNEDSLAELLRPERPISRVVIDNEYRIFLPEFENVEVQMRPLPKAVFLLFLHHPEGIVLKEIGDHFVELMKYYRGIMGIKFRESQARTSLARLCNPLDNSLNEKICRIHEALRHFIADETVAMQYFIRGKRSEVRQIMLPQTLISWAV